jgi:hypothetical protein
MAFDPRELAALLQTQVGPQPLPPVGPQPLPPPPAPVLKAPVTPAARTPAAGKTGVASVRAPNAARTAMANEESAEAELEAETLFNQLFAPQENQIADMQKQKKALEAQSSVADYNPLLAFTDAWIGTNSAQKLKPRGLTDSDKQKRLQEISDKINDNEAGVAKQKVDLIKSDKKQESDFFKLAGLLERQLASNDPMKATMAEMRMDDLIDRKAKDYQQRSSVFAKTRNLFSQLGQQQHRISSLRQVVDGKKNLDDVGLIQLAEFAHGMVPIVSGTNAAAGSDAQLDRFIPKTAWTDVTAIKDYITNKMNPAQAGAFLKAMVPILDREARVNETQIKRELRNVRTSAVFLKKWKPELLDDMGKDAGLTDADINEKEEQTLARWKKQAKEGVIGGALPSLQPITQEDFEQRLLKAAATKKKPPEQIREAFKNYLKGKNYDVEAIR